jgi:hypothetical protein
MPASANAFFTCTAAPADRSEAYQRTPDAVEAQPASLSYAAMSPGATRGVLRRTSRRTAESTRGTGRKLRRCTEPASCHVKVGQVRMVSSV